MDREQTLAVSRFYFQHLNPHPAWCEDMADGLLLLFRLLQHPACFCKHEYSATIKSKDKRADCIKQVQKNLYPYPFSPHYHRLRKKKSTFRICYFCQAWKRLIIQRNDAGFHIFNVNVWREMCGQKKTSVISILEERNLKATKLKQ